MAAASELLVGLDESNSRWTPIPTVGFGRVGMKHNWNGARTVANLRDRFDLHVELFSSLSRFLYRIRFRGGDLRFSAVPIVSYGSLRVHCTHVIHDR